MSNNENEFLLKAIITRYEQKVFSFVLLLVGGNQNQAYQVTVSSFAETILKKAPSHNDAHFFPRVLSCAIPKAKQAAKPLDLTPSSIFETSPEKQRAELWLRKALNNVSFEDKVRLLLRDQLHLLYKDIGTILKASESEAKKQTLEAREKLREKLQEVVDKES